MNEYDATQDKMFRFLGVLTIASFAGLQTWRTLFNNFAVEVANLDGYHVGQGNTWISGFTGYFYNYYNQRTPSFNSVYTNPWSRGWFNRVFSLVYWTHIYHIAHELWFSLL